MMGNSPSTPRHQRKPAPTTLSHKISASTSLDSGVSSMDQSFSCSETTEYGVRKWTGISLNRARLCNKDAASGSDTNVTHTSDLDQNMSRLRRSIFSLPLDVPSHKKASSSPSLWSRLTSNPTPHSVSVAETKSSPLQHSVSQILDQLQLQDIDSSLIREHPRWREAERILHKNPQLMMCFINTMKTMYLRESQELVAITDNLVKMDMKNSVSFPKQQSIFKEETSGLFDDLVFSKSALVEDKTSSSSETANKSRTSTHSKKEKPKMKRMGGNVGGNKKQKPLQASLSNMADQCSKVGSLRTPVVKFSITDESKDQYKTTKKPLVVNKNRLLDEKDHLKSNSLFTPESSLNSSRNIYSEYDIPTPGLVVP